MLRHYRARTHRRMFRQFLGNQVNRTEQALPEHPENGLFLNITIKAAKLSHIFFFWYEYLFLYREITFFIVCILISFIWFPCNHYKLWRLLSVLIHQRIYNHNHYMVLLWITVLLANPPHRDVFPWSLTSFQSVNGKNRLLWKASECRNELKKLYCKTAKTVAGKISQSSLMLLLK